MYVSKGGCTYKSPISDLAWTFVKTFSNKGNIVQCDPKWVRLYSRVHRWFRLSELGYLLCFSHLGVLYSRSQLVISILAYFGVSFSVPFSAHSPIACAHTLSDSFLTIVGVQFCGYQSVTQDVHVAPSHSRAGIAK